jgi:hypothetical protein
MKFKSFVKIVVALLFIIPFSTFAQKPSVAITIDKTEGNPGDTIIARFSFSKGDQSKYEVTRIAVSVNGAYKYRFRHGRMLVEEWTPDNAANLFIASAGYHHFRIMLEWKCKNNPNDTGTHGHSKTIDALISGWEKPGGYNHPGLFSTSEELDQMRKNINEDPEHPMSGAFKVLKAMRTTRQYIDGSKKFVYPTRLNYDPEPLKIVRFFLRDENDKLYEKLGIRTRERDIWDQASNAAWGDAIIWAVTKDQRYADKAIEILNQWAAVCTKIDDPGAYPNLHGTNSMGKWLEAAEILRYYKIDGKGSGWTESEIQNFNKKYVRGVLYPIAMGWLGNIGPWAAQNQPIFVAYARMNLGVYMDDEAMFMSGYDHAFKPQWKGYKFGYKDWDGERHFYEELFGRDLVSVSELTIGIDGTYMEINRDYGHMGMCVNATSMIMELLYHQGIEGYEMKINGEATPRFVKAMDWLYTHRLENTYFWNQRKGQEREPGQVVLDTIKILDIQEVAFNHYKYRLKDKYKLNKLTKSVEIARKGYYKNGHHVLVSQLWSSLFPAVTHSDVSKNIKTAAVDSKLFSSKIEIFPNPVNNRLNIKATQIIEQVALFSIDGHQLKIVDNICSKMVTINLNNLHTGLLFAKVKTKSGRVEVFKIIKK